MVSEIFHGVVEDLRFVLRPIRSSRNLFEIFESCIRFRGVTSPQNNGSSKLDYDRDPRQNLPSED